MFDEAACANRQIVLDELLRISKSERFWLSSYETILMFDSRFYSHALPRRVYKAFDNLSTDDENQVISDFASWRNIGE